MSTRRGFIKISAMGTAGVALAGSAIGVLNKSGLFAAEEGTQASLKAVHRYPTYCEVCFWKCAGWTYTDEQGRIQKIIGNENDPLCNGRLCPRGTGGIGMYYDPDRLKKPLIRVNRNGSQEFVEATWEEALDLVARKMKEIAEKYGPESMALFNHGSAGHHMGHLLKAYGSSNITAPSYAQCRGPREVGFEATFGSSVGSPEPTDIRNTKCLVLIGSHIGENMHNGQVQEMSDAIDNGATIITVDPRFSTAASKSKYWIPIKPATDMALLMAWIHVLIYEDLYNKDYISRYAFGFDQLKEHVKQMTPEWAYGITTIEPDIIRRTAWEMAKASPAVIVHPGRHVTWYGDDTQRSRAIAILNALLGSWGQRGGFYFKESPSVPDYPHPPFPKPKWSWKNIQGDQYKFARLSVSNALIDASVPGYMGEHKIHGWLVAGTNLPLTLPGMPVLFEAFNNLDFIAVVDTMPMEITGFADVVLPECTYLERYDELRDAPAREPYIALRMPAAEPMYETKPAWWIAREIGIRLGLGDYFNYENYSEVLDWQLRQIGSSLEEMQQIGIKKMDRTSGPLYITPGEDLTFNTNTGKIELYATDFAAEGFDPMPVYTEHEQPQQGYYRLIYGRTPPHTFSRTANNPNLTDLQDENYLWVNPKVARLWDLNTGDKVWLQNQDGVVSEFPIKVRVTERIRWDSIYMVHGFGHSDKKLTRAYGKGVNDSGLITNIKIDPLMGGTGMRSNFVTFLTEDPGKEAKL
ncbi:MAG: molybdopterin-dependent oxidoreductase [Bacteroidetes bacterium]|nr:molybdopterin-dependent oxidoreductase [Bacteroidota bacterium]